MSQRKDPKGVIGVAIHDVEPATWERCALIRDWLDDHGIDRVTLLVIPARDLHPLGERCPEMGAWLRERRHAGDSIAQNGFQHEPLGADPADGRGIRALRSVRSEFAGLDEGEARRAVDAGWRILKLSGIEPDGFVAPGYAYTRQLVKVLPRRFRWRATLLRVRSTAAGPPRAEPGQRPGARLGSGSEGAAGRGPGAAADPGRRAAVRAHPARGPQPRDPAAPPRDPRARGRAGPRELRRRPVTLGELSPMAATYPLAVKIEGASGTTAERPA